MAEQVSEASVLFADVSGSTKLYETAGDAVAHAAIEKCVNLMREKTVNAKGRVIKTIGDEVMSAFATADHAADAAIEMQSAISEMPPVGSTQIGIRIGFNHGPVVERDGDVFGDAVNLAARLAGVATKGQIITARDTVMLMAPMLKASTRAILRSENTTDIFWTAGRPRVCFPHAMPFICRSPSTSRCSAQRRRFSRASMTSRPFNVPQIRCGHRPYGRYTPCGFESCQVLSLWSSSVTVFCTRWSEPSSGRSLK